MTVRNSSQTNQNTKSKTVKAIRKKTPNPLTIIASAIVAVCGFAHAGSTAKEVVPPVVEDKSLCDTLFELPTLYKNEDNPYIQKFAFIGRYHGQLHYLDSNKGDDKTDLWENRRARIGAQVDFLKNFKFAFNFNLDLDEKAPRFFQDLEDATLTYSLDKATSFSVGKMKAPITNEWRTSSNKILTFERSAIVNYIVPDKMGGVLFSIQPKEGFLLDVGVYTNAIDEDWAYPTFDGGYSGFISVGYANKDLGTIRAEYLYSDINEDATENTKGFEHIASLNYHKNWGRFGLIADAIFGDSEAHGSVYGLTIMPTFDITKKLKLVTRYQIVGAEEQDGFKIQRRYERQAPDLKSTKGDFYQAVYAGLNYYICGDHLKLMAGAEYTNFDSSKNEDFDAISYLAGIRLYF